MQQQDKAKKAHEKAVKAEYKKKKALIKAQGEHEKAATELQKAEEYMNVSHYASVCLLKLSQRVLCRTRSVIIMRPSSRRRRRTPTSIISEGRKLKLM